VDGVVIKGPGGRRETRHTSEDHVHRQEVGADGESDHGKCEGEELEDDVSTLSISKLYIFIRSMSLNTTRFGGTNEGTAGVMFDLGSDLTSSWSR
jgi:hypothetical protein